jgi:hypothetical protein
LSRPPARRSCPSLSRQLVGACRSGGAHGRADGGHDRIPPARDAAPRGRRRRVDSWEIAKSLIFLMLLPLAIGLLVRGALPADRGDAAADRHARRDRRDRDPHGRAGRRQLPADHRYGREGKRPRRSDPARRRARDGLPLRRADGGSVMGLGTAQRNLSNRDRRGRAKLRWSAGGADDGDGRRRARPRAALSLLPAE